MFQLEVSDIVLRDHARRVESINHDGWMFTDLDPWKRENAGHRLRIRGRSQSVKHPALRD